MEASSTLALFLGALAFIVIISIIVVYYYKSSNVGPQGPQGQQGVQGPTGNTGPPGRSINASYNLNMTINSQPISNTLPTSMNITLNQMTLYWPSVDISNTYSASTMSNPIVVDTSPIFNTYSLVTNIPYNSNLLTYVIDGSKQNQLGTVQVSGNNLLIYPSIDISQPWTTKDGLNFGFGSGSIILILNN